MLPKGRILEDLDALAGTIAFDHCMPAQMHIVTATVDRINVNGRVGNTILVFVLARLGGHQCCRITDRATWGV
jgi:hypothetical protein